MDSCKYCNELSRELETMKANLCTVRRHKKDQLTRRQKQTSDRLTSKKRISPEIKSNDEKIQELLKECMRLLPNKQSTRCDECGKIFKNKRSLAAHTSKFHKVEKRLTSEAAECIKIEIE